MRQHSKQYRAGFSLVEVALAVMLIAIGMVSLFGLFPSALRQGETAISDTHVALFADYVTAGMRANSMTMHSWNQWADMAQFRTNILAGVTIGSSPGVAIRGDGVIHGPLEYPVGSSNFIIYVMDLSDAGYNSAMRAASLWVWSGQYGPTGDVGSFKANSEWFYTKFHFSSM